MMAGTKEPATIRPAYMCQTHLRGRSYFIAILIKMSDNKNSTKAYKLPEIKVSYNADPSDKMKTIIDTEDAAKTFLPVFNGFMRHHEEVWVMYLNHGLKVIGVSQISKGGYSGTVIDIRIIIQIALQCNSSRIIMAHNHPSGNLKESAEDIEAIKSLKTACNYLNIELIDSMILTDIGYNSIMLNSIHLFNR
ncbi:JAB domain-containing protein [Dysgonomonas termitidis]|uniref:JAB domain-containing protein n=1 Tax=Dysgonomonas termitidis TaxID=1516126 RepID=A0ABV9KS03_9BACT